MTGQRTILAVMTVVTVLALAPTLRADTKIVVTHGRGGLVTHHRIGTWIGRHAGPVCPIPARPRVVVGRPWRRRFVCLRPPVRPVVVHPPVVKVVHPPVQRHVVVEHPPTVRVKAPEPVAQGSVTVWITNSNGSRTSVTLERHGPWYVGPRGEYYTEMPTNEQLRTVYGF